MRVIPDDNLAYPIFITIDSKTAGSGFLLNTKEKLYFITAKHVLFDASGKIKGVNAVLIAQSKDINDDSTTNFVIDLPVLETEGNLFKHASKDVAAFVLGVVSPRADGSGYDISNVNGVALTQTAKYDLVAASANDVVKLIDDVLISNDVFIYGYPTSLALKESPQFDYSKPLLRKGIIANIYKAAGTIILDCPVYPGNSGGPVVQMSMRKEGIAHEVIGVVSQFIPYTEEWKNQTNGIIHQQISNSGYSVAVAMDYVFEIIDFVPTAKK